MREPKKFKKIKKRLCDKEREGTIERKKNKEKTCIYRAEEGVLTRRYYRSCLPNICLYPSFTFLFYGRSKHSAKIAPFVLESEEDMGVTDAQRTRQNSRHSHNTLDRFSSPQQDDSRAGDGFFSLIYSDVDIIAL